ncbi:MAG TPA: hypothetical protein VFV07_05745 [Rhizomicrobium sp.]|nr:hypothetical protein [Rhizomicrobium sp.]
MSRSIAAAALACGLTLSISAATAGVLVPVPSFPGSIASFVYGINNNNVVAGRYKDADGVDHGFFGTLDGNYTSFDFPGGSSFVTSINDAGDITGYAEASDPNCPLIGCEYIRKADGTMVEITKHGTPVDGQAEQIVKNRFVGEYWFLDDQENTHTNGYRGRMGAWKHDIVLPFENVGRTRVRGLNRQNEIAGFYTANGTEPGFVIKGGVATSAAYTGDPDAFATLLTGINGTGKIVGSWSSQDGTEGQALIYESSNDTFRVIAVPGETITFARQVNDAGVITVGGASSGYIYCTHKKLCPITAGAIEVTEKVVAATHPGAKQWVLCKNGCEKDSTDVRPASPAQLRAAIARDPSLLKELRDRR